MKTERRSAHIIHFVPNGDYYSEKGQEAYKRGDLLRAKKFFERALAFEPKETEILCQQAAVLAELEEYDKSNELLDQVVNELDPSLSECYFFLANNYAHMGHFKEALEEVKEYIAHDPNGPFIQEAKDLYRLLTMESGSWDQDEPQYIIDHEKGRKALDQGQNEEAIRLFKNVIKLKKNFWAAYNNIALAYYARGQYDNAFHYLNLVLVQNPGNIHALCNLTVIYEQLGMKEELKPLLAQLKKLYPIYPEHQSKLGSTFYLVGDYPLAYKWLSCAYKSGHHWESHFYYWFSLSAYQTGRLKQAMKAWNKVLFFREGNHHPFDYGKIRDMIRSEDAAQNPMVRSLLLQQIKDGEVAPKIYSLFLLRHFGDENARLELERYRSRWDESKELRWIAGQLLELMERSDMLVSLDGDNMDDRIKIMLYVEQLLGEGKPPIEAYPLYKWWSLIVKRTWDEENIDYKAWSLAMIYLYQKGSEPKTQKQLSQEHNISVYRLRKYIKELKQLLI